jgi:Domain of unknown function (DUF3332)
MRRRNFVQGLALVGVVAAQSGCFGSFNLSRALWKFNDGVSSSKWVKWLLFLGLIIVPVYQVCAGLLDLFIFNTIEFFTGNNPISAGRKNVGDGHELAYAPLSDNPKVLRVEHYHEGKLQRVFHIRRDDDEGLTMLDENMVVLSTVKRDANGELDLVLPGGKRIHMSRAEVERTSSRLEQNVPIDAAVAGLLESGTTG